MELDSVYVEDIVRRALEEDAARSDATVAFLAVHEKPVRAEVVAGEDGVAAGLGVAERVFRELDQTVDVSPGSRDGDRIRKGEVMMRVAGKAGVVLAGERVALNFLQRLCGVATLTSLCVERVNGTGITILDTRKTTPLWRDLEKYAVRCGGGMNHRRDLGDLILVKENHIAAMGGRDALLRFLAVRAVSSSMFLEIEVDSLEFLEAVLELDVDRVMLDNFTPDQVRKALGKIAAWRNGQRPVPFELEVSGGIDARNIADYALPGVDFISVGALTHSAPSLAMSLEVVR